MIAKRIAAAAAAAALILVAVIIRDQIIEGDSGEQPPADATVLVCPPELRSVCEAAAGDAIEVEPEEAGVTLDRLAAIGDAREAPIWVTFAPFPAMLADLRSEAAQAPLELDVEALAASPLALVTTDDVATELTDECGTPAPLRCSGGAGLSVGFARSPESGVGLLGLTGFALDYGAGGIPFDDALFERWVGTLVKSVSPTKMSNGTAIATFQTRDSSMDVAVGAEAELVGSGRDRFEVLYPEPMGRIEVVVAIPPGTSAPSGLRDSLRSELLQAGWSRADAVEGRTPEAGAVIAVRELWRDQT